MNSALVKSTHLLITALRKHDESFKSLDVRVLDISTVRLASQLNKDSYDDPASFTGRSKRGRTSYDNRAETHAYKPTGRRPGEPDEPSTSGGGPVGNQEEDEESDQIDVPLPYKVSVGDDSNRRPAL